MKEPLKIEIEEGVLILIWEHGYSFVTFYWSALKDRTFIDILEVHPRKQGFGRETLRFLNSIGLKNLEPKSIIITADGFWEKMLQEGLIVDKVRL